MSQSNNDASSKPGAQYEYPDPTISPEPTPHHTKPNTSSSNPTPAPSHYWTTTPVAPPATTQGPHAPINPLACGWCGEVFKSERGLDGHVNGLHLNVKPHPCKHGCGAMFFAEGEVRRQHQMKCGKNPQAAGRSQGQGQGRGQAGGGS